MLFLKGGGGCCLRGEGEGSFNRGGGGFLTGGLLFKGGAFKRGGVVRCCS